MRVWNPGSDNTFFLLRNVETESMACSVGTGAIFPRIKGPESEGSHLPPCGNEVKIE